MMKKMEYRRIVDSVIYFSLSKVTNKQIKKPKLKCRNLNTYFLDGWKVCIEENP